jgi:hypothetical protein
MMDRETWMTAEECVRLGFADRVEGELKAAAMACLPDTSKFRNAPSVPRGMEAIRDVAFTKFNRKLVRTAGGSVTYLEGGRRVIRET